MGKGSFLGKGRESTQLSLRRTRKYYRGHAVAYSIDAKVHDIKVGDYAEEHEELKTALTKWGAGKTGFQM